MKNSVVIVDYQCGNLRSLFNALIYLGITDPKISSDLDDLDNCSHIILPGVGSFKRSSDILYKSGLASKIINAVQEGKKLFGIMSLINDSSQFLFEQKLSNTDDLQVKGEYYRQRNINLIFGEMENL